MHSDSEAQSRNESIKKLRSFSDAIFSSHNIFENLVYEKSFFKHLSLVKEPKGLIMNFWQIKDYLVKNLNKNIIKRKEKEKNTTLLSIVKNFVSGYKGLS